jgi:hypothetical protein
MPATVTDPLDRIDARLRCGGPQLLVVMWLGDECRAKIGSSPGQLLPAVKGTGRDVPCALAALADEIARVHR